MVEDVYEKLRALLDRASAVPPAPEIIERSLRSSPTAQIPARGIPRKSASRSSPAHLETREGTTSQ